MTLSPSWGGDTVAYLSRIWLNPLRRGTQRLLRSPQVAHALILGAMSSQPVTERVLWRLELRTPPRAELLVLSHSLPSWEQLVEQAGWPKAVEFEPRIRPYEPLLDRIVDGREFHFRLRANPVTSTRSPTKPSARQREHLACDRPRGVRVAHRTSAHQLDWFVQRVSKWGFDVTGEHATPAVQLVMRERVAFSKSVDGGTRHQVVLQAATFEGRLRVSNREAALASLLGGIGPGRAYGCGLLTLAPVSRLAPPPGRQ